MTPHDLVGRRVKVLSWDDLRDILPADPNGTVTHVVEFGAGDMDLTVRIEGLTRDFVFGLDEVQVLPGPRPAGGPTAAGSG